MNYPGNSSLSSAVKDRVVSTFRQTLALFHQRRTDEVMAGCTLILQMDPMFDPARKLMEKTRNPGLSIDVDSLLPTEAAGAPSMQEAREAMAARDFERVQQITSAILSDDLLNDDARILGDEAREKLEAAPFVSQFTRKCDQNIAAGNIAAAKMDLEKARALDPTHPEVLRVAKALTARSAAPPQPAAPPPSFIVDEPLPTPSSRSTAQAADFGFSFEEEKSDQGGFSDFSFDTPVDPSSFASPAPADTGFGGGGFSFDSGSSSTGSINVDPYAPSDEFDFATASVVTSSDDEKKIQQYLSDGDRAFASGEYQQAIDLWSRIFLIDVTNDEASDRIEKAKAKRRELEQRVEPLLNSGITAFERGNTAQAHTDLNEVLKIDPHNPTAQEYLDRLGETVAKPQSHVPPSVKDDNLDLGFLDDEALPAGFEAPLIPPAPGEIPAPAATGKNKSGKISKAKPSSGRNLPVPLIAAIVGVIVLLGGGWFVWTRMHKTEEPVAAASGQSIIARATTLAGAGKYDQAIALLQDIKPNDPAHDQALLLIADLRNKKTSTAQMIDGIPADQYYEQKLTDGRTAFAAHDYAVAKTAFDEAMRAKPLPPDAKEQYDITVQQVAKLNAAKALFAERKFDDAITNLQSLLEQDPQNLAIQRLMTDAHFNNGAIALQQERTSDAMRAFDEVLRAQPEDVSAKRARDLAARYDGQPKDLLYKIYVNYLPLRQPS
jgi:tetratricopeptide (TPR) repeat protein